MKRITPAEVVAAYAKLGATPARGTFYQHGTPGQPDCCCGLGAVIVAANDGILPQRFWDAVIALCGDYLYVCGFISGFEGGVRDCWQEEEFPSYAIGVADGRAAAIAVGLIKEGAST